MNETMHDHADHDDPAARPIPSLVALGRQFDLAAASAIAAERRRTPRSWGLAVAPAFAILVAMMLVSVRLSPAAEASVVHAAERTAARVTGRFTMRTHVAATNGSAVDAPIDLSSAGTYDRSSGRLKSTLDLSRVLGGASGTTGPLGPLGAPVETIKDGPRVYLQADIFSKTLPAHRSWVMLDTSRLNPSSGLSITEGIDSTVTDPASFLEALRGIGDDTHAVGEEDIDGIATVHYQGTVSLDRAAKQLSAAEQQRLRQGFESIGVAADQLTLPMDVWVDPQGEVRRVGTTLDVVSSATAGTTTGTILGAARSTTPVSVMIDYRDLGLPSPIALPRAQDTSDITDLVNAALAGPLQSLTTPGTTAGTTPR